MQVDATAVPVHSVSRLHSRDNVSGGASSENSPGPGKVLKMFARSQVLKVLILLVHLSMVFHYFCMCYTLTF